VSRCEVRGDVATTPLCCDLPPHDSGLHYDGAEEIWWQTSAEHEQEELR
jgi:hypothetical protein